MGRRSEEKGMKELKKSIIIEIRREDALSKKEAHYDVYEISAERGMTILEILNEIYEKLDESLAFRHYHCRRGICLSCTVKLNGKIVRACATLLWPGRKYLLEPAYGEALIKDLVFDFSAITPD
ncbi:MAG: 2Fe-2S iron-sulfur cluster-binding protein [Thermodesulfobacteriota bacterium]